MTRVLLATFLLLALAAPASAEDVPLQTCDRLPVAPVRVSGIDFLFLVDTAATSMLNIRSFSRGEGRTMAVTSWNGTVETRAQEITLADFVLGQHHLKRLRLPAIDLSSISRACGGRIDGILGIDLLSRLGASVDLKNRTAHLRDGRSSSESRIAELHQQLLACEQAFNRADEPAFSECLDPGVVLYSAGGDFYGRDASMDYYRRRYFHHDPRPLLTITPRAHHEIGDAIWVEYDLRIEMGAQVLLARATALCEKKPGRWRIIHMNHSSPRPTRSRRKLANRVTVKKNHLHDD